MLNGKQKRFLRSQANSLKATVMIGKEGISDTLIESLDNSLEAHELVKVSILKTCDIDSNELLIELLSSSRAELVQTIGRQIILYRKSKDHKIILP